MHVLKQPPDGFCSKRCSYKFCKIHRKTSVLESPAQVFSCEFCELYKDTFFTEHLWTTASACWIKTTFTWEAKWIQTVMRFHLVENLTSVFSQLFICVHMNWGEMKLKTMWISYRSFWPKWKSKPAWDFHVNRIYPKRNE